MRLRLLLASLSILVLTLLWSADGPRIVITGNNNTGGGCGTTNTTLPHDLMITGFEGTGYEASTGTWTETGAPDEDADISALTSGKPSGSCAQGLLTTIAGANLYTQFDYGSTITLTTQGLDVYCYFYLQTAPDSGEGFYILSLSPGTDTTTARARLFLENIAGTINLTAQGDTTSAAETITTGTWHLFKLHVDTAITGTTSYIQVDGGTQRTFNRDSGSDNFRYLAIGATQFASGADSMVAYWDLVIWDRP